MMKKRLVSELKKLAAVMLLGVAYYAFVTTMGFGIPCVFNKVTGLLCPGCGISRMLIAITHLDFLGAFGYNRFLFVTMPIMLILFICNEGRYIKTGERDLDKLSKCMVFGEAVLLLAFGIIRNLI